MSAAVPPTRVEPVTDRLHDDAITDPYRWLEEDSAATRAWTEQQNRYTADLLARGPGRESWRDRLGALLQAGFASSPVARGGRVFFTMRQGAQNQPLLYVREGDATRALLDPNTWSADGTVAIDWWHPSPDGARVAYGVSASGDERSTLRLLDVAAGRDQGETIPDTRYCSVAWLPDAGGFFYTRLPAAGSVPPGEENYHQRVRFHRLGADPAADPVVFGEGFPSEERFEVDLAPGGRWLLVTASEGWVKSEVYLKDLRAGRPDDAAGFVPVATGRDALYAGQILDDRLYLLTNDGAPNYRVFAVDPARPARAGWREVVPEGDALLQACRAVGPVLALCYLRDAVAAVRLADRDGRPAGDLALPGLGTVAELDGEPDGGEFFFTYTSFFDPPGIYRYDLAAGALAPYERVAAPLDTAAFVAEQVHYTSRDGTEVPMFLLHRRDLARDGRRPVVLTGYGGFNIALAPAYNAGFLAWVERGGVIAQPSLRGGSEYGERWHRAGMLGNKQNVFDDFLAAAEWLIAAGYTDRDHLGIRGGSNGGLLVGAALTQRPELFRAVVCAVPLLDMLRYHHFLIARLWIPEYGSADDPEQYAWLRAYSPYHHVERGTRYPAILFTAAESDSRVHPLHARKMAALVQASTTANPDERPVLLRVETKAGHGAGKPQGKLLDEQVDIWGFLAWQLGVG
ncbi:MAG TPA: prolyl oligopeptidase family serine peptidase [Thermomicrobiales bacterium]|nr:prolyl oligopeptidase family serine peptidase [Thermomicrobiales bacterium]